MNNVIMYDGDCPFCNSVVNYIFEIDRKKKFMFSPLQSKFSKCTLKLHGIDLVELNTVYFLSNGVLYHKSGAVLKILGKLPFPFFLLQIFSLMPRSWRDAGYMVVSRNRLKLMSKKSCRLYTAEDRKRIIM
ncbi:thiol-disulfide oxidoreductase DCC family protein [Aureibacter tunicatorum]|uniref:DCC family thiol-disulfide oxidoreductase YuxK n=1 Tax=Aureibacter tunicatorum TaxID=866807 RepID=A0AAE3XN88_9BACT|nr:DCC1-like thiol-disulfide oxidoreductase family protein [Aureibacter tunicatorum]MDR6239703.1 putative DCC family thiol-disulfide oxidoreductase YuxK [Aureibacter tunicatorum]BDD04179.1 hypothetical protein AUTU_16620 [Aureibacter tunicatorum]